MKLNKRGKDRQLHSHTWNKQDRIEQKRIAHGSGKLMY